MRGREGSACRDDVARCFEEWERYPPVPPRVVRAWERPFRVPVPKVLQGEAGPLAMAPTWKLHRTHQVGESRRCPPGMLPPGMGRRCCQPDCGD